MVKVGLLGGMATFGEDLGREEGGEGGSALGEAAGSAF